MIAVWVLLGVVIVLFAVLLLFLGRIFWEIQRVADWTESVEFPAVEGFGFSELRYILLAAARMEFPDKRGVIGRRRASFSRRSMDGFMGRDRFETLRDALVTQGYLVHRGERYPLRWTPKGRLLLFHVMAGRFGDVDMSQFEVKSGRIQWRDADVGGRLYRVDVK